MWEFQGIPCNQNISIAFFLNLLQYITVDSKSKQTRSNVTRRKIRVTKTTMLCLITTSGTMSIENSCVVMFSIEIGPLIQAQKQLIDHMFKKSMRFFKTCM